MAEQNSPRSTQKHQMHADDELEQIPRKWDGSSPARNGAERCERSSNIEPILPVFLLHKL